MFDGGCMIYIFILLLILTVLYVMYSFIKDRRYVGKRTIESIGKELWFEIDRERQEAIEKGKRFRKTLDDAKRR